MTPRHPFLLALCVVGALAGCLHEASRTCGSGGVCPPGLLCADTDEDRICILVTCGNGQIDLGEVCDDANTRSGDGCPVNCSAPCGDRVLDPGEACDDGNAEDGDGCAGDCKLAEGLFSVTPTEATFAAIEGDVPPAAATISVRLRYRGDTVSVGYPPGASQPSWLSFAANAPTATTAEFQVQVTNTTAVGPRSTTVRFTLIHENSNEHEFFDLPVMYNVQASDLALQTTPTALEFTAVAGGTVPAAQPIQVTFNGADAAALSMPSWMTVSAPPAPTTSPSTFDLAVNSTAFAIGTTLSGNVVFRSTRGTLTRLAIVHVTYKLVEAPPEVQFVAPYVGIAGRGGTLRVRGRGFLATPGPATVGIGTLAIGQLLPDSDTQITVSYPPLPAGTYPVTFNPADGNPTHADLVIVAPPAFTYQAISAPSPRRRIIYDAERQTIYAANSLDGEVERFVYSGGTWSTLPPRVMPLLTDVALVPNGRSLIAITRDTINEISLTDNLFVPVARATNPDPFCTGFGRGFDHITPANHGRFFVLMQCNGTDSYLYDLRTHSLTDTFLLPFNPRVGGSADGSRIYIGDNGSSPVRFFDSLSNTFVTSSTQGGITDISVSGDASRVVIDHGVYSRSLTFLGNLPFHGRVLVSRDSSRAFLYAVNAPGPRIEVYNLNGPLQAGGQYPLLKTVILADAANTAGTHTPVAMTSSLDDSTVFVSGNSKLLVVPVN